MKIISPRCRRVRITVVVTGRPQTAELDDDCPLWHLKKSALIRSGNTGRPVTDWEIRDQTGKSWPEFYRLDQVQAPDNILFLNLKPGTAA
jgi:hypothetical protein